MDVSGTFSLDDNHALSAVFNGSLLEQVELTALHVQPNGSVVTWAVNTQTGATSEYSNYDFNSFAKVGNAYLGASSSGLYALHGDDDAGNDIVSLIRTGVIQAGARPFCPEAAYIGMRGDGQLVLRVIDEAGKSHTYTATASTMRTAKVKFGRGLRSRYFSFELETAGQDFDLDGIEFIPVQATRRV
jgi:hypothetical protein